MRILQPSCLPASPPICAGLSARTPSPPKTADTCIQLPCACFQLTHANSIAHANNILQLDRVRVHQPEFLRKCKRFSNRSMLRTTAPCANLQQPRRNGRSPGRSAAALPSKHPQGRADAERQCRTPYTPHSAYFFSSGKTRATRPTGPPRPGAPEYGKW